MSTLRDKYQREITALLTELVVKASKLTRHKNPFSVNGLNQAQELTSLASDIERAIYVSIEAETFRREAASEKALRREKAC